MQMYNIIEVQGKNKCTADMMSTVSSYKTNSS
jgi:hypothetical protein